MKYPEQHEYHQLKRLIELAVAAHEDQFDIGGRPYFLHPLTVMQKVAEQHSDDLILMQIAIGHDLLEDTWVTEEHLQNLGISKRVIDGIIALTKVEGKSLKEYRKQVLESVDAMKVKLADLEHNSDISRLPDGLTDKDLRRLENYKIFKEEIIAKLESLK